MMSEMVERVARAIYEADDPWHAAFPWPNLGEKPNRPDEYRRIARAAIEAMKEPTEAMLKAGFFANVFDNRGGCPGVPHGEPCADWNDGGAIEAYMAQTGICRVARITKPADDVWTAMITEALK